MFFADVAQLGERHLAKVEVVGSNPIIRSGFFYANEAHVAEQPVGIGQVAGSNPVVSSTQFLKRARGRVA